MSGVNSGNNTITAATRLLILDSRDRDGTVWPTPATCRIPVPAVPGRRLMKLVGYSVPKTIYNITATTNTVIFEYGGVEYEVSIDPGSYSVPAFFNELGDQLLALNLTGIAIYLLNNFKVQVSHSSITHRFMFSDPRSTINPRLFGVPVQNEGDNWPLAGPAFTYKSLTICTPGLPSYAYLRVNNISRPNLHTSSATPSAFSIPLEISQETQLTYAGLSSKGECVTLTQGVYIGDEVITDLFIELLDHDMSPLELHVDYTLTFLLL